ncbi:MAG: pantoate--beta-alanine ligase [Chloroflexota bacterium]|nr:pantoate--beta-alanine ligase [Chloroflexota bacterium]
MTIVVHTPGELASHRTPGQPVGLVPTMGALHEGHLSLIRRAAEENDLVVVSVFVNPTQFNDPSDLARYPRTLDDDTRLAASAGASVIYAPAVETIYPPGFATGVHVAGVTDLWEGESRPGHFDGVATVVSILLNQVRPDRSYFGEKDFQQLAMIRRLHRDLSLPGEIVPCPTVRERDGLAMSSRNARLDVTDRTAAPALNEALDAMREAAIGGERSALKLAILGAVMVKRATQFELDYLQVVDPVSLDPLEVVTPGARAIVAATIGGVRLIDNLALLDDGTKS